MPGYFRLVPPGQDTLFRCRIFLKLALMGLKPWELAPNATRPERMPDREFILAIVMTFSTELQKRFVRPSLLKPLQGLLSKTSLPRVKTPGLSPVAASRQSSSQLRVIFLPFITVADSSL